MEKIKKLIDKILDVPKLIVTLWIILWLVLFILVAFKFCFNIWYPIVIENETFIAICNFIDSKLILRYAIYVLFYILNLNLVVLTSIRRYKYYNVWQFIIFNILIVCSYLLKMLSNVLGIVFEVIVLVILPTIINLKKDSFKIKLLNIVFPLAFYIIINLFQTNILFVRGIDKVISELPTLINLTLQFDYYVFIINSWIGVNYIMGLLGAGWWWSHQITKYRAYIEKELKRKEPDMEYVSYCEARIKEFENKLNESKVSR